MNCWKCGTLLPISGRKISFRDVCENCGISLHCCHNCTYYKPGRANDCAIPGTEHVADRAVNNFCEDFASLNVHTSKPVREDKQKFNDLFKS